METDLFGEPVAATAPNKFGPKLEAGAADAFAAWPTIEQNLVVNNMLDWAVTELLPGLELSFRSYREARDADPTTYFAKLMAPKTADEREWADELLADIGCVVGRSPLFRAAMADQKGSVDDYVDLICRAFPREVKLWSTKSRGGELFA